MRSRLVLLLAAACSLVVASTVAAPPEGLAVSLERAAPAPPTQSERVWSRGLIRWGNRVARAANTVSNTLLTEGMLTAVIAGDRSLIIGPIETLRGCTRLLRTSAGPPPSARARAVQRLFKKACRTFEQGIRVIERGLDVLDPDVVYGGLVGLDIGRDQALSAVDAMGDLFGR